MVQLSAKASVTQAEDGSHSSQLNLAVPMSDVKVKATLKDVTLTKEPRYRKGLVLGVEKPGDFSIDYNVGDRLIWKCLDLSSFAISQAWKFQYDTSIKVLGPPLKLSYTHSHLKHDTTLQAAVLLNPATKLTTKWDFQKERATVKLSHTRGSTTLEPGYDQGAGTVSFAATQRISKKSTLRASYDQKGKQASVEWSRQGSDEGGPIKIAATTTAGANRQPKVTLEKSFNLFW